MGQERYDRLSERLGVRYGTARARLERQLLFYLAQQLKQDVCYRCSKPIASVEEFSIEHKESWILGDPNLFWQLDNIAFSHLLCNSHAGRQSAAKVVKANRPDDDLFPCHKCREQKPREAFSLNTTGNYKDADGIGIQSTCKECHRVAERHRKRIMRDKARVAKGLQPKHPELLDEAA